MALESTRPLTEWSTRNLPGGKGRSARKADNVTAICEPIAWKMWEPRHLATLWASTVCYRDSFSFTYLSVATMRKLYFVSINIYHRSNTKFTEA
jgi:hypothetical protein